MTAHRIPSNALPGGAGLLKSGPRHHSVDKVVIVCRDVHDHRTLCARSSRSLHPQVGEHLCVEGCAGDLLFGFLAVRSAGPWINFAKKFNEVHKAKPRQHWDN